MLAVKLYLVAVSVVDSQFLQNVFGFDSFSPPSVPLLSVTLGALSLDWRLLQPSVVELDDKSRLRPVKEICCSWIFFLNHNESNKIVQMYEFTAVICYHDWYLLNSFRSEGDID